jgi:hypothetical protein
MQIRQRAQLKRSSGICVTRVTIATSKLPKNPMNSACAGARPSTNVPATAYQALCAANNVIAIGSHA